MRCPWKKDGRSVREDDLLGERERELRAAEADVARIRERADKVLIPLERRLQRNYWGEAAAAIARREH